MIAKGVMEDPKMTDIIDEFNAFLNVKKTINDIYKHCQNFLKALYKVEGAYGGVADSLGEDWTEAIEKEVGPACSFKFEYNN